MPTIDMFHPRALTEATLQIKPVQTFFLDRFFKVTEQHNTDLIDVEIYKGKRVVAPYTKSGNKATPLERIPWSSQPMRIPYIKLSRNLEAVLLALRTMGETIYSNRSMADRAREILAKDLVELDDAITRAEELQAAQAVIYGKATIKGEDINAEADYQRAAGNTYTVGTLWSNALGDPGSDLRAAALVMQQASGFTPTVVLLGQNVYNVFHKNPLVLSLLDNRNGRFGSLQSNVPQYPGATYFGTFEGFEFWGYNEWYLDDVTNTELPMIPVDSIVLVGAGARFKRHYGPIIDLDSLIPEKRFTKSWLVQDPSSRMMAMHSAPLMVPHDVDATMLIKVI